MAYTKGPWTAKETPAGNPAVYAGGPKCTGWTGRVTNRPFCVVDTMDDAHLIAAAPDMYEALKAVQDYVADDNEDPADDVADMVDAAIKKAEGE